MPFAMLLPLCINDAIIAFLSIEDIMLIMNIFLKLLLITTLLSSISFAKQNYAVILQYHRFNEEKYPSTSVSMERFAQQIEYLKKNDFTIWPFTKVVAYLLAKKELPPKTVSITIDDAYKSVYTQAYPFLKKNHIPFMVFVNSLAIGSKANHYLSWDEMREMGANGAEYANHTYSHQFLVRDGFKHEKDYKKYMLKEIQKAELKIEKELGNKVATNPKMIAYPFGEYDLKLANFVKELGYVGVAQNSAPISTESNFLALTRFPVSNHFGEMKSFCLKVNSLPLPVESISNEDTIVTTTNNPPKLVIKLQKPIKDLQCFTSNGEKIDMRWLSDARVEVQSPLALKYPRDHYTCTAHFKGKQWYWFSHMWVVLKEKKGLNSKYPQ